jgi:hypothetical protein
MQTRKEDYWNAWNAAILEALMAQISKLFYGKKRV